MNSVSDYRVGLGVAFHLRATAQTDGSSHYNGLHRKWLWFAEFVFAARFRAFMTSTYSQGATFTASFIVSRQPNAAANELCDLKEEA